MKFLAAFLLITFKSAYAQDPGAARPVIEPSVEVEFVHDGNTEGPKKGVFVATSIDAQGGIRVVMSDSVTAPFHGFKHSPYEFAARLRQALVDGTRPFGPSMFLDFETQLSENKLPHAKDFRVRYAVPHDSGSFPQQVPVGGRRPLAGQSYAPWTRNYSPLIGRRRESTRFTGRTWVGEGKKAGFITTGPGHDGVTYVQTDSESVSEHGDHDRDPHLEARRMEARLRRVTQKSITDVRFDLNATSGLVGRDAPSNFIIIHQGRVEVVDYTIPQHSPDEPIYRIAAEMKVALSQGRISMEGAVAHLATLHEKDPRKFLAQLQRKRYQGACPALEQ